MTSDQPRTPEDLAARYVWWQPADATLRELDVLLWQILKLGTADDYVLARSLWGETAFRDALARARPGALDERSWAFWHRHYGMPVPAYPRRQFTAGSGTASVKLSFFGGLRFGRVAEPLRAENGVAVAAPLDLLATKLKTLHDRVEARDYIDIEALLRAGLRLDEGLAAAMALFGPALNPLDTAKAVGWFKDGGLEATLPDATRRYLAAAAAGFNPAVTPMPIRSRSLAD